MYCVIQSDPGGLIVSEKEAWRIDQPVKVGVSVEVRHSGLSGRPDLRDNLVGMVGGH